MQKRAKCLGWPSDPLRAHRIVQSGASVFMLRVPLFYCIFEIMLFSSHCVFLLRVQSGVSGTGETSLTAHPWEPQIETASGLPFKEGFPALRKQNLLRSSPKVASSLCRLESPLPLCRLVLEARGLDTTSAPRVNAKVC